MQNQIWQHTTSGERYCVTVDGEGNVYGAAGPLHYTEISLDDLGDYETECDGAEDMRGHPDAYRVLSDDEIRAIETQAEDMSHHA